ncbi:Predicted HD phosphohydrolase [Legionella lansingensis]|uniref:HD domain protein n=1 Tax=Legionella lansingensis TaxID=45067 RepID=A0A0W0VTP0_9GAMM|nr:HD domain-containing protein [Legionella lansingensis]KTD23531.1 HD domain protein [Legionella lansingensis]SNV52032.1 Predicted HD phosphohydrolase [Legionella lansingensis]
MMDIEQKIHTAFQWLTLAKDMDYIGEQVSQCEHALQCAYFAEQSGHDCDVILACLFHDIGHFASKTPQYKMADLGIVNHEWIGAKLAYDLGFSAKVALLIGYHVDAKRYLAGKKKNYFARLSEASKGTLTFQGGVMSGEETSHLETHTYFRDILRVRINDEKAKEVGLNVPDLNHYHPYLHDHLKKNIRTNHDITLPDYIDNLWVAQLRTYLEKEAKKGF